MSDRLALAHAIEDAGIPREKAEQVATAIARFVEGSAATKADVQASTATLKVDLNAATANLKGAIAAVDGKLNVALWGAGILFAALFASQAALWIGMGKIDGQLAQIGAQVSEIAHAVQR